MKIPACSRPPKQGLATRRTFGKQMVLAGLALAAAPVSSLGAAAPVKRFPLAVFSKAFQQLGFAETADLVAEVGWDGIECPVRKGGQVLPERVEEDLPKMVEALKQRGLEILLMATDVRNASDPLALKVLRTASRLGIKRYRLAPMRYDLSKSILPQLEEIKAQFKDIAALNQELGMAGAIQNHSGANYVGAPIWDIMEIMRELDRRHCGICFDIGHATVEGGTSWPIQARLMEPFLQAVFVKDFNWGKGSSGPAIQWCSLGQGMISRQFFNWLKKTGFAGPISQHFEYDFGQGEAMKSAFKRDLATLREWLAV